MKLKKRELMAFVYTNYFQAGSGGFVRTKNEGGKHGKKKRNRPWHSVTIKKGGEATTRPPYVLGCGEVTHEKASMENPR